MHAPLNLLNPKNLDHLTFPTSHIPLSPYRQNLWKWQYFFCSFVRMWSLLLGSSLPNLLLLCHWVAIVVLINIFVRRVGTITCICLRDFVEFGAPTEWYILLNACNNLIHFINIIINLFFAIPIWHYLHLLSTLWPLHGYVWNGDFGLNLFHNLLQKVKWLC